jgi:hypothetical protein
MRDSEDGISYTALLDFWTLFLSVQLSSSSRRTTGPTEIAVSTNKISPHPNKKKQVTSGITSSYMSSTF